MKYGNQDIVPERHNNETEWNDDGENKQQEKNKSGESGSVHFVLF
jgi:hypothetical protein